MTGLASGRFRIFRERIPVDDQVHEMHLGRIVHVDCREPEAVEVWFEAHDADDDAAPRPEVMRLQVFGTGHPVPAGAVHVGTALSPALPPFVRRGALVWHLYRLPD